MSTSYISMLKTLCNGDAQLFNQVIEEMKEQITFEVVDGIRQVDTQATLEFALQLESASFDDCLTRRTTHFLLSSRAKNAKLIDALLGRKGRDFRASA